MPETTQKFACSACGREFNWKPELAGKRAKCKCGQMIDIPAELPHPEAEDDGLYDLAELAADAEKQVSKLPPTIVEPPPPPPKVKSKAAAKTQKPKAAPAIARNDQDDSDVFIDKTRDLYVPSAMLAVGTILHAAYYLFHYNLKMSAVAPMTVGLTIMALIESVLMIGIALVIAGPLGIGFGDIRTACGKFAAIVVLCDGVTTWVNGLAQKLTGGVTPGLLGFASIGLAATIIVYLTGMCYLFSLDVSEAKLAMVILAFFKRVIMLILLILLLPLFALVAMLVRLDSSGPALFRQRRVGKAFGDPHHVAVERWLIVAANVDIACFLI